MDLRVSDTLGDENDIFFFCVINRSGQDRSWSRWPRPPTFNLRSYPSVVRQLMTVTTIKTGPCFWIFWFFFPEDLAISEAVEIRNQKMSDEEVGCMHGDVVCMVMLCATVCRNLISFPAYLQSSALVEGGYNRGIHDARVTLVSPCLRQEFVQFLKSGALV